MEDRCLPKIQAKHQIKRPQIESETLSPGINVKLFEATSGKYLESKVLTYRKNSHQTAIKPIP